MIFLLKLENNKWKEIGALAQKDYYENLIAKLSKKELLVVSENSADIKFSDSVSSYFSKCQTVKAQEAFDCINSDFKSPSASPSPQAEAPSLLEQGIARV